MNFSRVWIGSLLAFFSIFALLVLADSSAPTISSITLVSDGSEPVVKVKGKNFGHDAASVQVMVNENGSFATVISVKPQKLLVRLPAAQICAGKVIVRVLVNRAASNAATFEVASGGPTIESIDRQQAEAGSVIEIRGSHFSCELQKNIVSFNTISTAPLAINGNLLSVRVPEGLPAGQVEVKVSVDGQVSASLPLAIEPPASTGGGAHFTNTTDIPGSAGFAPLFAINDSALSDLSDNSESGEDFWSANFFGTHQAIVNAPWMTRDGRPQQALLTINFGRSNSLVGNRTGQWEKFAYMRINYPLYPEMAYDPDTNPFWWGSSALCTEHFPHGELYYNSLTRATGGVDSFALTTSIPGQTQLSLTMKVVAPDLFNYEQYGVNYAKAGAGMVVMPKVATVTVNLPRIEARIPVPQFQVGRVTIIDESGTNGRTVTNEAPFASGILTTTNQPQL